jgi:hypothetical protein
MMTDGACQSRVHWRRDMSLKTKKQIVRKGLEKGCPTQKTKEARKVHKLFEKLIQFLPNLQE